MNATSRFLVIVAGFSLCRVTASAAPFAYIPNWVDNTVSVVDTAGATPVVVATVPVGSGPFGVAVNRAGTFAYVTNRNGNTISVIDATTNTVAATVAVGGGLNVLPTGVAVNTRGTRVYTANYWGDSVSVIDTATNTVLTEVTLPGYCGFQPWGIAVKPDDGAIYVGTQSNGVGGAICFIDAQTLSASYINLPVPTGQTAATPWGLAVNPQGNRLYVAVNVSPSNDGKLDIVDLSTGSVQQQLSLGSNFSSFGVALDDTGHKAIVTDWLGGKIKTINLTCSACGTASVSATFTAPAAATGVAFAPGSDITAWIALAGSSNTLDAFSTNINRFYTGTTVGSYPVAFGTFLGPGAVY